MRAPSHNKKRRLAGDTPLPAQIFCSGENIDEPGYPSPTWRDNAISIGLGQLHLPIADGGGDDDAAITSTA